MSTDANRLNLWTGGALRRRAHLAPKKYLPDFGGGQVDLEIHLQSLFGMPPNTPSEPHSTLILEKTRAPNTYPKVLASRVLQGSGSQCPRNRDGDAIAPPSH
ncbi:MAG: hypothetical protein ACI9F9_002631 [Candidatus Paceibacteria bacterium]|jgi:hypothetical protein